MACLAQILYPPPTHYGWDEWCQAHQAHHDAIEAGISAAFGVQSIKYNLFPFFKKDISNWLLLNEQAHTRMAEYLQFGTQDLSNLDFEDKTAFQDWLWLHYQEHLAAAQRLGTTIT